MRELLERYPALAPCGQSIRDALALMKGFLSRRALGAGDREKLRAMYPEDYEAFAKTLQKGVPAISLPSQTALLTAYANDVSAEMAYAQMVFAYGRAGDLVIGLSTSGNSKNVVNAIKIVRVLGLSTLALTGAAPCALDGLCDAVIKAPQTETYKAQEYHLPVYHYLCAALERALPEAQTVQEK